MSLYTEASIIITPNAVKEDKLYAIKPGDGSGDLDVVRATTATRVNSEGLIEPSPYNLTTYSEQFDNASWSKSGATISVNTTVAPDGTLTADSLIENTSNAEHLIQRTIPVLASTNHTISLYVKSNGSARFIRVNFFRSSSPFTSIGSITINLSNGKISGVSVGTVKVTNVNNGWLRVEAMGMTLTNEVIARFQLGNSALGFVYTGDGSSGAYIWGAQLVSGTSAKEYFPTTDRLDVPRLDYANGGCPSILVEPQRTNLYTYSEQLNQWDKIGTFTVTENDSISPAGTQTADRVQFASSGNVLFRSGTGSAGSNTISVYAKAKNGVSANFRFFANGNTLLSSNQVATGEWQRFTFTYTYSSLTAGLAAPTTGASDVLFYGFQHEIGSYATSYIPTIASSVTRNADQISKTGISGLINSVEGTIFVEMASLTSTTTFSTIVLSNGTVSNRITIGYQSGTNIFFIESSGASTGFAKYNIPIISTNMNKIALSYKINDVKLYINGVLASSANTFSGFSANTFSRLGFDNGSGSSNFLYARVKSVQLYKTALTNSELAQLTTI